MLMRVAATLVALLVVLVVVFASAMMTVCTDRAFVDRATGKRWGYRDWVLGIRTDEWREVSGLEVFVRSQVSASHESDPVSYRGTGRNLWGGATYRGHGSPGPVLGLSPKQITEYCQLVSDEEKMALHAVFSQGDDEAISDAVDRVLRAVSP